MTGPSLLSLTLEPGSEDGRISGRIRGEDGKVWPFSSWLGLLTLIERLRASAASPTDKPVNEEAP